MTHPTNEELDEMARDLCHTGELSMLYRCEISDAITTLRAQIADAQAELHGPIKHLSAQDYSNVIAHLSPELEPNGELPNRNSLMMALVEATNAAREANARADRAEAALAAQIEADAGEPIAWAYSHAAGGYTVCDDEYEAWCGAENIGREMTVRPLYFIRKQPHDRAALVVAPAPLAEALRVPEVKALEHLAAAFEVYADDCDAFIARGLGRKSDNKVKAETWRYAAEDVRSTLRAIAGGEA